MQEGLQLDKPRPLTTSGRQGHAQGGVDEVVGRFKGRANAKGQQLAPVQSVEEAPRLHPALDVRSLGLSRHSALSITVPREAVECPGKARHARKYLCCAAGWLQSWAVPSQFSAIGFTVSSGEDLAELASRVTERAETIDAAAGQYLKWAPSSGEQLWLQVKRNGDAMGMNPHFEGKSSVRIAVEARVARDGHTPLDGTFLAWANPPAGSATGGDYPFAFDCPDAATHDALTLPVTLTAQIAAFAQQLTVHESQEAYDAAQAAQGLSFGSRSFIPSGLISPSGEPITPPESHALIAGLVVEAGERRNAVTGQPFWWALVDTVGGTFDVVIDPALLSKPVRPGNVTAGWFWLSGRLQTSAGRTGGWLRKLTGR